MIGVLVVGDDTSSFKQTVEVDVDVDDEADEEDDDDVIVSVSVREWVSDRESRELRR